MLLRRLNFAVPLRRTYVTGLLAVTLSALCQPSVYSSDRSQTESRAELGIGDKLYQQADQVFQCATNVHYQHLHEPAQGQVSFSADGKQCDCVNDCSGFISYIIDKIAPKQYAEISRMQSNHTYPQAKTFAQFFSDLPTDRSDRGWLKIDKVSELRRGDLIAWEKKPIPGKKSGNSGHVMIVAAPPSKAFYDTSTDQTYRYVSVPVIDSSSVDHFQPEELPPHAMAQHRDGIGKGCVRVLIDEEDRPIGYWEGTYWNEGSKPIQHASIAPVIACARLIAN
jgi:hypothetical protein